MMMMMFGDGRGKDAVGRIADGAFENHRAMKDLRIVARRKALSKDPLDQGLPGVKLMK